MSKDWYYALAGASNGPVSDAEFQTLITTGTIRSDTLVWQEGMDDWLPYGRASGVDAGQDTVPPKSFNAPNDPARADSNSFVGALKDGFARYVDFKTRSTRSQFWWWTLWSILISIGASILDGALGASQSGPVNLVVSLGMFLPSIAVAIRRLHDIGRVGWWVLLWLIPVIGWIVLIVFFCQRTQDTANEWGLPPKH